MGKQWKQWQTLFPWTPKSLQMVTAAMKLKDACSLEEKLWPTWKKKRKKESEVAQSSPTVCNPMDCSPPSSSIHGIFQARVLEWIASFFSRGSSWLRDQTQVCHCGHTLYHLSHQDSILKNRDIILPTKVCIVKAMAFPVVMYRCESWTIKKTEHQRIHTFEPWCWRRLLRIPGNARRSNQSILKEISPEYSLEYSLMLKLRYFGHVMQRTNSLEKTLKLGKAGEEGDDKGQDDWTASQTQCIWAWASFRRWWRTGKPGVLQSMGSQSVGHDLATKQQQIQGTWGMLSNGGGDLYIAWFFIKNKHEKKTLY